MIETGSIHGGRSIRNGSRFQEFLGDVASYLQRLLNRPALCNQALDVIARRQVDALGKFFEVESNDVFHVLGLCFRNRSHQADFKRAAIPRRIVRSGPGTPRRSR